MNKFKFYFIVLCSLFALFSCNKADDTYYEPLHFYSAQYVTDMTMIEDYLKTHYIANPDNTGDEDIIMAPINGDATRVSIFDSPLLHSKEVFYNNVTYKVYYLKLREGVGAAPTKVDQVLTSYDGSFLSTVAGVTEKTRFEYVQFPTLFFELNYTIVGWQEIFPLFKTGTVEAAEGPDPAVYNDFGAGVMFLPSALAYYNVAQTNPTPDIPAYSPLIFSFKLYDLKNSDNDGDGILSNDEDLNHDGDFTNDDTDGDGVQNYLDADDDGDGYLTKVETKKPADETSGSSAYYPYNPIADDPSTPIDETETKGVPDCSGDFTSADRVRKYLNRNCH